MRLGEYHWHQKGIFEYVVRIYGYAPPPPFLEYVVWMYGYASPPPFDLSLPPTSTVAPPNPDGIHPPKYPEGWRSWFSFVSCKILSYHISIPLVLLHFLTFSCIPKAQAQTHHWEGGPGRSFHTPSRFACQCIRRAEDHNHIGIRWGDVRVILGTPPVLNKRILVAELFLQGSIWLYDKHRVLT